MIIKVISSTDNKYVGLQFDTEAPFISPDGILFKIDKIQYFGDGHYRYSNSSYIIDAVEVKD